MSSLRVAINQSNYLPWKGYFDLIHDADLFIFLDDVQYTKNDWRNRNRIKGPNGTHWLTVPVGGSTSQKIRDVPLPPENPWREKHRRALIQTYAKAPYLADYESFLENVFVARTWRTLAELNRFLIETISRDFLGIETRFADSGEFDAPGSGQDRVLALLHAAGATSYISGPAAKAYLDPARFAAEGIELVWKDYSNYPEYVQPPAPFEHAVSIVDLLFRTGPSAPDYIWGWRSGS
jgi:WbqC-like protein family